jgi:predicted hydrocarbon binding protein
MSSNELSPHQTVIACISNSVSSMLGRGSRAAMREAGKAASYELWPELPENASPEEIAKLMHEGVAQLEGFGDFELTPQDDGTFKIAFNQCGFAQFTEQSGEPCGSQPICFMGFGLVEETLRRMTGRKMLVTLEERDEAAGTCHEVAAPR